MLQGWQITPKRIRISDQLNLIFYLHGDLIDQIYLVIFSNNEIGQVLMTCNDLMFHGQDFLDKFIADFFSAISFLTVRECVQASAIDENPAIDMFQ